VRSHSESVRPAEAKRKEVLVVETLPLFSFQRTGAPCRTTRPDRAKPDTTTTFGRCQPPTERRSESSASRSRGIDPPRGSVLRSPCLRNLPARQRGGPGCPEPRERRPQTSTGPAHMLFPVRPALWISKISPVSVTTSSRLDRGGEI